MFSSTSFLRSFYRLYWTVAGFILLSGLLATSVFAVYPSDGTWEDLQQRGTLALDANQYWIAEPLLKKAMSKAEKTYPKDMHLAKSLAELGRLYTIRGRFSEAEIYLEEELGVKERVLGDDKYQCIPNMGSLIQFYITHGTQSKAIPLTEEMLSLVEGKLSEVRSQKQKVKLQKGQPLQAWLGVAAQEAQDPIIEWAITCDSVGNAFRSINNFEMAERLFKAALNIKMTVLGSTHLSLANSYDSLGSLCMERSDFAEAESFFIDALKVTEKVLPPESHEVFIRLDKLAKCFIKQDKYKEAEDLYLRAKDFWKNEPSKYGDDIRLLFALGDLYAQQHKYEMALPYLQQALKRAEDFNGPDSIALVPYLRRYAYCLYYVGNKKGEEQLKARANMISGDGQ